MELDYHEEGVLLVKLSVALVPERKLKVMERAEMMLETGFELVLVKAVSSAGLTAAAAAGCWKVGSFQIEAQVDWAESAVTATKLVVPKDLA